MALNFFLTDFWFQSVPGEYHSVLLLPHVNANDFEHVLKFIYEGEIKINQKDLKSFLHVARILKIKGMDFDDEVSLFMAIRFKSVKSSRSWSH